jgi:hypothetical protein
MDAAFLSRTLRTTIWMGALLTLCAYAYTHSGIATWSFGLGASFGALMVKSTEIFVRRLIRAKDAPPYSGWDAPIPLWALLPLKWGLIVASLALLFYYQMINAVAFAIGFPTVQLVFMARFLGRVMSPRTRSVREVYVNPGRPDVQDI